MRIGRRSWSRETDAHYAGDMKLSWKQLMRKSWLLGLRLDEVREITFLGEFGRDGFRGGVRRYIEAYNKTRSDEKEAADHNPQCILAS